MSTFTLDAIAITKANHQSKPGKTAIILLSGAVFLGIGGTAWIGLRAEFEKTFHKFSACPIVAMDHATLHARDGNRVDT